MKSKKFTKLTWQNMMIIPIPRIGTNQRPTILLIGQKTSSTLFGIGKIHIPNH